MPITTRNGIKFRAYPNRCKSALRRTEYLAILDTLYEQTRDTAEGNGTDYQVELVKILDANKDEVSDHDHDPVGDSHLISVYRPYRCIPKSVQRVIVDLLKAQR